MATAYEVTVKRPGAARGAEVEIPGLGLFKDGSTKIVTKDEADAFRTYHSRPVVSEESQDLAAPQYVTENGPTVLEAFKGTDWVTVESITVDEEGNKVEEKSSTTPASPATTTTDKGGDK